MNYQVMEIHGGNLNVYYKVKEACLESLHSAWLQLYDILEKAKLCRQSKNQRLLEVQEEEWISRQITEDF